MSLPLWEQPQRLDPEVGSAQPLPRGPLGAAVSPEAPKALCSADVTSAHEEGDFDLGGREPWRFLGGTHSACPELWMEVTLFLCFSWSR